MRVRTIRNQGRGLALLVAIAAVAITLGWQATQRPAMAVTGVTFDVTQSPDATAPVFVQPGTTVTFHITGTTAVPVTIPGLSIDFNYPPGLTFVGSSPGICAVASGKVTCDYGPVNATTLVPVDMTFTANATFVTSAGQFHAREGSEGLAAQLAPNSFTGAGTVNVFSSPDFTFGDTLAPASPMFEGGLALYTATLTNNSGAATGGFTFNASFPGMTVQAVSAAGSLSCSSGTQGGAGSNTATCTGANLGAGATLTVTVPLLAPNASAGYNVSPQITAPAIGFSKTSTSAIQVSEVGLSKTGPGALQAGTGIDVCTAGPVSDVADTSAGGEAQPATTARLVSPTPPGNLPLALADFAISPGTYSGVAASILCGANQSGIHFVPGAQGVYTVTVSYNAGGTNTLALSVATNDNPNPTLSNINPLTANAGGSGFTLTVTGSGYVNGVTRVQWGGSDRTTTCTSATTCTAAITGTDIASAGTVAVRVYNPLPGGGTSNSVNFTVNAAPNPVPTLTNVSPNSATAGAAATTITVTGSNFVANSVVRWASTDLATSLTDATHLSATIPANLLAAVGTTQITVFNPGPGGGTSAQQIAFTVNSGATKLAFTTQPSGAVVSTAFTAQPVVAVQNASSNTVTVDSTTVVTLALVGGGGSAHLACTGGLSKTVTSGVATFAGCAVDATGTGYTITASATSLTSATSSTFDVAAAPPTSTTQLAVVVPANGAKVARSRLTFSATTGTLSPAPTKVSFVIKRKSDNKYWDASTSAWVANVVANDATAGANPSDPWTLAITGAGRRLFVNTTVSVEARAVSGSTNYVSQATPEIAIR